MAISLDDSQLLRLAADPRLRLFGSLKGSTVFRPIVMLAGLLPCVAVVLSSELSDESAAWALRALDVSAATQLQQWLEPGFDGLGASVRYQPPLSAWLMASLVPRLGTRELSSWLALSLAATSGAVWISHVLGRRLGGASLGLATTLIICGHPVILRLATDTSPAGVGLVLIGLSVWGFLGHLEGLPQLVSVRMLAGALAWGLSLLAVGPVAVALLIPMTVHVWLMAVESIRSVSPDKQKHRAWHIWIGLRSLVLFIVTGISFSSWWQFMMLAEHGLPFWNSWWTGQVDVAFLNSAPKPFWKIWVIQNSLILAWLVVGLATGILDLRRSPNELLRRRMRFFLCWWLTAFVIRLLFEFDDCRMCILRDSWDSFLLLPTALLAAWGLRSIVLRRTNPFLEALVLAATIGLCIWRITGRQMPGVAAFLGGFLLFALLPVIVAMIRRNSEPWKERDWGRLLRFAIGVQFVAQLAAGLIEYPDPSSDSRSLAELRHHVSRIQTMPRVTFLTSAGAPESLLFVLRSQWPHSQFVLSAQRDGATTGDSPTSSSAVITDEIVIEWTRREFRLATEFSPNRLTTAIGNPLRFRGRKLMVYRVSPKQN